MRPIDARAVMASRREPPDSLDFFPTPPWATRALFAHVLDPLRLCGASNVMAVLEPACGEGHMAEVLRERFAVVRASDIHDYGGGYEVADFLADDPREPVDWIITNPPFALAERFAQRALAAPGPPNVALLLRTQWLHGQDRLARLFRPCPPAVVGLFAERVAMVKGRWDPAASTATDYAWVVWHRLWAGPPQLVWIPPCRVDLTRAEDVARFAVPAAAPLLGGEAC